MLSLEEQGDIRNLGIDPEGVHVAFFQAAAPLYVGVAHHAHRLEEPVVALHGSPAAPVSVAREALHALAVGRLRGEALAAVNVEVAGVRAPSGIGAPLPAVWAHNEVEAVEALARHLVDRAGLQELVFAGAARPRWRDAVSASDAARRAAAGAGPLTVALDCLPLLAPLQLAGETVVSVMPRADVLAFERLVAEAGVSH